VRRWWSLLLVGLLAYGVFLGLRLPIDWWFEHLQPPLPSTLRFERLDGTLLEGSAQGVQWNGIPLGRLDWQLAAGELLRAGLGYRCSLTGNAHRLAARVSLTVDRTLRLHDLTGRLPLSLAAELIDRSLLLDGGLELDLEQVMLSANGRLHRIEGLIRLTEARLQPMPDSVLGPFRAVFDPGSDAGIDAVLEDEGGPVLLEARLQLEPDGVYRIRGRLQARPDSPPQLGNLLAALGGGGPFDLNGRWF
jgi:hypothetical protein